MEWSGVGWGGVRRERERERGERAGVGGVAAKRRRWFALLRSARCPSVLEFVDVSGDDGGR